MFRDINIYTHISSLFIMILNLSVENLTQSHYIVKVHSHRAIANVKAMATTDLLNANIFTDLKGGQ